jgi:hypothetical protein
MLQSGKKEEKIFGQKHAGKPYCSKLPTPGYQRYRRSNSAKKMVFIKRHSE